MDIDELMESLGHPLSAAAKRNMARHSTYYRRSDWVRKNLFPWTNWPILVYIYNFWTSLWEEGIRATCKPRWGFDLSTDGEANNSEPAQKDWVYARIRITPHEDTNRVGDPHEFTATVETFNGTDWLPFAGANVTFELTSGPGALDPLADITDGNGEAKTTLTSDVVGTSIVRASTTVNSFDISTNGTGGSSGPAQKDWVYARIPITPPNDTNVVGDPHVFTATVETSTDGTTWAPFVGANVTFKCGRQHIGRQCFGTMIHKLGALATVITVIKNRRMFSRNADHSRLRGQIV